MTRPIDVESIVEAERQRARAMESTATNPIGRARQRIQTAAEKAARKAAVHPDHDRALYSDGQAAGLRAALRILEEEAGR